MAQGPMSSILVTIRVTIRIRESVPDHDPDPGRTTTIPSFQLGTVTLAGGWLLVSRDCLSAP